MDATLSAHQKLELHSSDTVLVAELIGFISDAELCTHGDNLSENLIDLLLLNSSHVHCAILALV